MWGNSPVWYVYINPYLSLGFIMATNIKWTAVFLSLEGFFLVCFNFFYGLDIFFRSWFNWPNYVACDLGRCFLIFQSFFMGQVDSFPFLKALMIVEVVALNTALC